MYGAGSVGPSNLGTSTVEELQKDLTYMKEQLTALQAAATIQRNQLGDT